MITLLQRGCLSRSKNEGFTDSDLSGFFAVPACLCGWIVLKISALRRCAEEELMMRCLFTHRWIMGKAFNVRSSVPCIASVLPCRTCERCGTMQRGIYDLLSGHISWETMRERNYIEVEKIRIVRKPTSRLDQLAHTLGLRRSRVRDKTRSGKRPAMPRRWRA